MIVNNRPDGEDAGQPLAADIEAAAQSGGPRLSPYPDPLRHRPGRRRGDARSAERDRRRQAARLLPLGHPLGPGLGGGPRRATASTPDELRPLRRQPPASTSARSRICSSRSASSRTRLGSTSSSSTISRTGDQRAAQSNAVHFRCRTATASMPSAAETRPRELRPRCGCQIAGELDERHHQGTTSPAAISSGRGARPSIALRCGKRPKRSMTSMMLLRIAEQIVVAERGEQRSDWRWSARSSLCWNGM